MREKHAKAAEKELEKQQADADDPNSLLLADSTSCTYPAARPDKEDDRYITWYTNDGIYCRKTGSTSEYEWTIPFTSEDQYDKVMNFIRQLPSDWNLRFAAHENFWTDFLNDDIDTDSFLEFMKNTDHGIPNYTTTSDDGSMHTDRDKIQWAKYFNPFENRFCTREEFQKKWENEIATNKAKLTKLVHPSEQAESGIDLTSFILHTTGKERIKQYEY